MDRTVGHLSLMAIILIVLVSHIAPQNISINNCHYYKIDSLNITRCTICHNGYQLNLNYTNCSLCSAFDSLCLRCDFDSVKVTLFCQECAEGYSIVNGKCMRKSECLDKNCWECKISQSICQSCNNGYYLNSSDAKCYKCAYQGQTSPSNDTCSCSSGQYLDISLDNPQCLRCTYPCQQCSGQRDNCTLCIYGYFNSTISAKCQLCITPNCIICESASICLNCTLGYLLANGICQVQLQQQNIQNYINLPEFYYFCTKGCFYCYKYDFCVTCLEGYSRNLFSNACDQCSLGCQMCGSLENMACFTCYQGYRLTNASCQKCEDVNCLNCSTSKNTCISCAVSFTGVTGKCLPCALNCLKCDHLGNGTCDENQCSHGFARTSNTTCTLCALGCYSCSTVDVSTCISCPIGSFQALGGQCQICPSECVTCSSTSSCLSCRDNYRLINNLCSKNCLYPCLDCSAFNYLICSSCYDGYVLAEDLTCQPDIKCNNYQNCTICPVAYYLNVYNMICQLCQLQQNCIKCQTESTKCAICLEGYYLLQNSCFKCSSNCQTCQLQDYCFSCQSGFFLYKVDKYQVYGQCLVCSTNCLTCIDEASKCNSCNSNDILIGFRCVTSKNIIFEITMQHHSITAENAEQLALIKEIMPFTLYLANIFGPPFSNNPEMLYLKDISSGSIQVTYMATISNYDPLLLLNTIVTALNSFHSFKDFAILNTQIITNGFQSDIVIGPPSTTFVISLLPSPFFLLFLIAIVWKCYLAKKTQEKPAVSPPFLSINLDTMASSKSLKGDGAGAVNL